MPLTEKQKKAKRKRYKNASEETKSNYAKYQKEKFKNVAASYSRPEAEYISAIFAAHGVTPREVMRGAAAALLDGEPIRTQSEPLTIPTAEADGENADTDEPPTT